MESDNHFAIPVFGGLGFVLSLGDLLSIQKMAGGGFSWLSTHIGRMSGAFIASVTAFLVAGSATYFPVVLYGPHPDRYYLYFYWICNVRGGCRRISRHW